MAVLADLEKALNDIFGKKAPALPKSGKDFLVTYVPYISLIIGLFSLASLWSLWHWAHEANKIIEYANQLSRMYGTHEVIASRMTVGIWLSLLVLAVEAFLYLAAFGPTKAREKTGWNLLFYATLVNIVYGFILMFTDYSGVGSFIGTLIGSALGFYFLFQIRDRYLGIAKVAVKTPHKTDKK
ncbi:MAG TPA: hypothetical protein VJ843_00805 [Candidatus Saccharimonadales bacterium]|nr:hypothetical protein [Candidatus Saccharimonadales bacterium]